MKKTSNEEIENLERQVKAYLEDYDKFKKRFIELVEENKKLKEENRELKEN